MIHNKIGVAQAQQTGETRLGGRCPLWGAFGIVGLLLSPLLIGFEPMGWDPDLMYRPIKGELARALGEGRLPFWSERFGLGLPLVAESHAAAFYPPHWAAYRLLGVSSAYALQMWLHFAATAAATFAYARVLGITPWGSALAGILFTLGGFQAAHACHEPFYMLMPYLPLCLLLTERYLASGRAGWLAALAMAWGLQLTLGHFQIQMWTGGLVALTAIWHAFSRRAIWRRCSLAIAALVWGGSIAAVQLGLTWELTRVSRFDRVEETLINYQYPPEHLAQWALPAFYLTRNHNPIYDSIEPYWGPHWASAQESTAYVGVVGLLLACVGLIAAFRDRRRPSSLSMWCWVSAAGAALATMPWWWMPGYRLLLLLPGVGWFRAPGRYILLPSLGIALLAGKGLDREVTRERFWPGLAFGLVLGLAGLGWTTWYLRDPLFPGSLQPSAIPWRFAASAVTWAIALAAILCWRSGRVGAWGPIGVAAIELGALFYVGPTSWGWRIPFPGSSPTFARLAREPNVGLVAGRTVDLPARAGKAVAYPLTGITSPPPIGILMPTCFWFANPGSDLDERWRRRFGVTHGIWGADDDIGNAEVLVSGEDKVLGNILENNRDPRERRKWKLVRYPTPFPAAWVAKRARQARDRRSLITNLSHGDLENEAWFLPEDRPVEAEDDPASGPSIVRLGPDGARVGELDLGLPATTAGVTEWDGRSGVVEHDGSCVLIVRRAHYPGWMVRIDGGPEQPVNRVSDGLQGIVLKGRGRNRVETFYRPTRLRELAALSLTSLSAALFVLAVSAWRFKRQPDRDQLASAKFSSRSAG